VLVPASEVIHYGHRSVAMIWDEAMRKSRMGRARYMRLHHGRLGLWWDAALEAAVRGARRVHEPVPNPRPVELGPLATTPSLEVARGAGPYLLELALDPFFLFPCGRFDDARRPEISPATWRSLYPTTYWLRALDLDHWVALGCWTFRKETAA